jgi:hypothetical protein
MIQRETMSEIEVNANQKPNLKKVSDLKTVLVESKKEKKAFIDLPWKIYNPKDHPQWVPPLKMMIESALDTKKNPFYKQAEIQLFNTYQNGKHVGRIAAIDNQAYNDYHKAQAGFYGFFECIDDQRVANELFSHAENWLLLRKKRKMIGPVSPSTNHECGLLVRGQSQHPSLLTPWNPRYYVDLHEKNGMKNAKDLLAYILLHEHAAAIPERFFKHVEQLKKDESIRFRDFDVRNFERDLNICYDIYNSAWENNWGFIPMTREEFLYSARNLKHVMDPRFAFIAEVNGDPAGFMIGILDYNHIFKRIKNGRLLPTGILKILLGKRFLKTIRIITLGIKEEYRKKGIFPAFTLEGFNRGVKAKMLAGEASWILEDNRPMNKPWIDLGAPVYRRWRLYEKSL